MGKGIGRADAAAFGLRVMAVLALGLVVPGLHAQALARAGLPPLVELPAERDHVLRDYETAWAAGDADALAALFTEDGFQLRPRRAPVMGRAAFREAYAGAGGPLVLRAYAFAIGESVAHVIGGFAPTASDDQEVRAVAGARSVRPLVDRGGHRQRELTIGLQGPPGLQQSPLLILREPRPRLLGPAVEGLAAPGQSACSVYACPSTPRD